MRRDFGRQFLGVSRAWRTFDCTAHGGGKTFALFSTIGPANQESVAAESRGVGCPLSLTRSPLFLTRSVPADRRANQPLLRPGLPGRRPVPRNASRIPRHAGSLPSPACQSAHFGWRELNRHCQLRGALQRWPAGATSRQRSDCRYATRSASCSGVRLETSPSGMEEII
jgi:hypothetical protein